jgi:hypothetical protein
MNHLLPGFSPPQANRRLNPGSRCAVRSQPAIEFHHALTTEEGFIEVGTGPGNINARAIRENGTWLFFSYWTESNELHRLASANSPVGDDIITDG